jgi:hypothetical protein
MRSKKSSSYDYRLFAQSWVEKILAYPNVSLPTQSLAIAEEELEEPLPGFHTIDQAFILSIAKLKTSLGMYIADGTLKRPHNVLLFAKPGSGKSHFVGSLGKGFSAPVVTANLSGSDLSDTLEYVVNEARNYKALDAVPIIFLDEVDSETSIIPTLLPLLWDGEFFSRAHLLKIGRCIIICAVSDPDIVEFASKGEAFDEQQLKFRKLPDFLSRFGGGTFTIPSINVDTRRYDRVWIALQLIKRRFPQIAGVQAQFLQFVERSLFIHETRSMEALLNSLPRKAIRRDILVVDNLMIELLRKQLSEGALRHHISTKRDPFSCLKEFSPSKVKEYIVWYEPGL